MPSQAHKMGWDELLKSLSIIRRKEERVDLTKGKPASAKDAGFLGGRVHATGCSMICTYSIMADDSECKFNSGSPHSGHCVQKSIMLY
jgi:hypothetical protein